MFKQIDGHVCFLLNTDFTKSIELPITPDNGLAKMFLIIRKCNLGILLGPEARGGIVFLNFVLLGNV